MKTKINILIISLVSTLAVNAQIENIKIDSTIVIDKIYAGSLSGTAFSTDSLCSSGFVGIRFGAMATYKPASWIAVKSWAMMQIDPKANPWTLQQFWVKLTPIQKFSLEVGSTATLATELRPHPVSDGGQFETWAQGQIPGGSLTTKLKYQATSDLELGTGIAVRDNKAEYSGRIAYKKVKLVTWYTQSTNKVGIAMTGDFDKFSTTLVWKKNQTIADLFVLTLNKKEKISFFSDMGYDINKKDLVRGEWGVLKGFEYQWIKGLFALSYCNDNKSVAGYLFIHI